MARWFKPLADFQPADLPEPPRSFWQLAGPSAVLVGLSVGAGEIIVWPRAGSIAMMLVASLVYMGFALSSFVL